MKSAGYILVILISLVSLTPKNRRVEIPLKDIEIHNEKTSDSLSNLLAIKKDSLDNIKNEVKELQIELGVRK